jgi:chitodextrinase
MATAGTVAAKPAPDTIIDSGPPAATTSTTAAFTFHSNQSPATFSCRLDGSAYVSCASPTAFSGLAAGAHTFYVYATVGGVSDPSPATATWTIDLTPPSAPASLTATATTPSSVSLSWTAGQDNVAVAKNVITRNGSTLTTVGAVTSYVDASVAPATTYTYTVVAQDAAGNTSPASNSATVVTPSAPDTLIDSGPTSPTNSTSATFTFHSTAAGAAFTCKLDGGKAASCTSPRSYTGLTSGNHSFSVFATANGMSDPTPAVATWIIDLIAPSVPTGLVATRGPASVTLNWSASTDNVAVAGYDVFRGATLLASVGNVVVYIDSTVQAGVTYAYSLRARDAAGNVSAMSTAVSARVQASFDSHLTRAPYLTDLVDLHVAINFATDQSATTATVVYGPVSSGVCSLTTTVNASRISILVGTVSEYQWKGDITLGATGTYCYRVFLAGSDLLAGNASPSFTSQVQFGSTESFSFVVFGDWGQVDASGQNGYQAALMQQIAGSGARFAVTVGDNGYPNGNQVNYGDLQQSGADTSAIFGPDFWTVPGSSIPIFTAVGNHGVSGVKHTDITTWTQATAVATSGGRYQNDVYCCVNGSFSANYGSEWYAFSAGNVRFYILDSAWGDTNGGTANPYANDALAHFAPGTPEYTWLLNDLTTHPTQLKFAFSHFPFYSDNNTQTSDIYLQGPANLEGLLGSHGVQLVFNGHAHTYQRNKASAGGMPITYVTGGGGATPEPIGPCTTLDTYGIGWSPTSQTGSKCGLGIAPTSAGQLYHFLKVSVNGTAVTVTPTDSNGRTFDEQTYNFKVPTDTYIDSGPPLGTSSTSATFTFHASGSPASYKCQLDANSQTSCLSPITYSNLAQAKHTFKVTATFNKSVDPTPALASWTVDTTSPGIPGTLAASTSSPFDVKLTWGPAADNLGVTGYDIFRDGTLYQSVGVVTTFADAVLGSSTHQYSVRARDIAGNVSPLGNQVSITTAPPPPPVFSDGFESGDFTAWDSSGGLVVETASVNSGSKAAEGDTTNGDTFAKTALPSTYTDGYARLWFNVVSQVSQVNLLRLRDSGGNSIGYAYIDSTGLLGFHNDAMGTNDLSGFSPGPGWHALELHIKTDASAGTVEIWVDNQLVADLSGTGLNTGAGPIASMQVGEVQSGRTYDVIFDDAAFGTARLGPEADNVPPSVPNGLGATAVSPFEADLSWNASTDNVSVAGYDIFRDGAAIASVGAVLSYNDTGTSAGATHTYTIRSRDASGNVSALSAPATVTQPPAPPPTFADGFETGDLTSWTSTGGLTVEGVDTRSGAYAAEGSTAIGSTFAKRTLPSTYTDAYARVAFEVKSQGSQMTLLRLRDTPTGNGGFIYLTSGGKLGFRSDALTAGTTSAIAPGPGWHAVELHLHVNGTSSLVEVWLDGTAVPDLTFPSIDLGTAPIGVLQVGDSATSGTWDVVFDDAAFGTSRLGASGDSTAPSTPANVASSATSAFSVQVAWDASTDDVGVTGYDVFRNGSQIAQVQAPGYTDYTALAGTTYSYAVRARDASGNVSPLSALAPATTPAAALPLFADGFESSDLSAWTASGGLVVESTDSHSGQSAAEGNTTLGSTYARRALGSTYSDAYARVAFEVKSQASQVTLLRLRDTPTGNGGYVYLTAGGKLAFHNDNTSLSTVSALGPGLGWHVVELHLQLNGAAGIVEVWLDGAAVADLTSNGVDLGGAPMGILQIGDTAPTGTWDVVFDNAAFGVGRLGPSPDVTPPSVPANLVANADTPFSVQVGWDPSTDDQSVGGYDLYRNGALLVSLSAVTTYSDGAVVAGTTYTYAVRARDISGNMSALSAGVAATTPAAALPIFADGFESADLSAWTTTLGMSAESTDAHSGGFAGDANATAGLTYAKETLPAAYADAYARTAFKVNSQASQVTLLRLRDTPTGNGGYIFLTAGGKLAFRSDALLAATVSSVAPGPGWHVVELHLLVNGTSSAVEVWLDGTAVPDLTISAIDLGTAPIHVIQIGDTATTGAWDVLFDDVAFGTSRLGLSGDTTAPSAPSNLNAIASSPFLVQVTWDPSTDNVGVTGYDVIRDGVVIAQVTASSYSDGSVLPSESHEYTVRARDVSGNVSALSVSDFVTTPAAAVPVFADGFESGDGSSWTTVSNLTTEGTNVNSGGFAEEGSTSATAAFAKKTLPGTYGDAFARVAFDVITQGSQVTLLRLRDTPTGNGGYILLSSTGKLAFHNDATGATTNSTVAPGGGWHVVELHLQMNGASSSVETWLDGAPVPDLTLSGITLGTNPVGVLQIGDTATGTWDVLFDDAAFSTSRIGPGGDTVAPSEPGNLAATTPSPFSVQLTWDASTDDVAVTGYDLFRNGLLLAQPSNPGYTDNTALAATTYQYSVRARDAYGNASTTAVVSVTTAAAAVPIFADGFEGANAWTTNSTFTVETTDVHSGSAAAEGNTTAGNRFAKKTLSSTYTDAYARVAFEVKSQSSQVTLLRLRNTPTGTGGFVFLTSGGKLAFRSDALATATTSTVSPGSGWHVLELHLTINGPSSVVEVWLDGVAVPDLTFAAIDLGTAPMGNLQIGDTATTGTWDIVFDDAAFSSSRIGVQ